MSARHRAGTGHVDRNAGPAPVPVLARPDYGGAPAPFGAPRGREARLPTASRNPLRRPATIRGRMARMLVLPVVGMLVLFGILVSRESDEYLETNAVSQEVRLSLTVQNMIHELQRERGLTAGLLGGDTRFRPDLVEQRRQTDDARAVLDSALAHTDVSARDTVRTALGSLDNQDKVRATVDAGTANQNATFDFYTAAVDALSVDLTTSDVGDLTLREHLASLRTLGDAKEALARERGFLSAVFAAGRFTGDEYVRFAGIRAARLAALDSYDRTATPAQRARVTAATSTPAAQRADGYEALAIGAPDGRKLSVEPRQWFDTMTTVVDDLRGVQRSVGGDALARVASLRHREAVELSVLMGLTAMLLLVILAEAIMLVASSRAITAPLSILAQEADDLAARRLPEAMARIGGRGEQHVPLQPVRVPNGASTEILRVARALDNLQQAAYGLAIEQAVVRRNTTESLANLGRRNQNLIRRQLGFISQLEREESDPSELANLFELDHLATRMRRNAESLLVLAGKTSPRRHAEPVALVDVIRAAVGEVEEYRRVELRRIDAGYLSGAAVADITHIIAELVENGLAFSPPELNVEIFGRWVGFQYLVAIVDQGVGMTNEDLAVANARLRGQEHFLVGPAKFIGHYVVGRLSQDLGAGVQLAHSPVTGVTARLVLPSTIVSASREPLRAVPPASTTDSRQPVPAGPHHGEHDHEHEQDHEDVGVPAIPVGPPSMTGSNESGKPAEHPTGPAPVESYPAWPVPVASATGAGQRNGNGNSNGPHRAPDRQGGTAGFNGRDAAVGPDRTRNGLPKRRRGALASAPPPAVSSPPADAATIDRQPTDVRAMLSAFRAGTLRGESEATTSSTSMPNQETW